ncbi:MAG: hypothetical protein ACK44Q_16320 [Pirellulaceae bacterium]|jgi:hypothetical protein
MGEPNRGEPVGQWLQVLPEPEPTNVIVPIGSAKKVQRAIDARGLPSNRFPPVHLEKWWIA